MNERDKRAIEQALADQGFQVMEIPIKTPENRDPKEIIEALFPEMNDIVMQAQMTINDEFPTRNFKVDELAFMFSDMAMADQSACDMAMADGTIVFNSSFDHVHTRPHNTHYDVKYRFVQNSNYLWRIEVMNIVDGYSPLHNALHHSSTWTEYPEGLPVHTSFKVDTEEEYDEVMSAFDSSHNWMLGQACQSSYGDFSYWKWTGDGTDSRPANKVWIKPRFNRRDAS